jgi:3-deoxy-7-phosphoheptulonate synthase
VVKLKKVTLKRDNTEDKSRPMIISGPCSVENYEVMDKTVNFLSNLGIEYIRGGAFKPRTSPYSFQGLGDEGLEILKAVKTKYGVKIVSEVMDVRDINDVSDVADILQIGSRNMYNYSLLKEIGRTNKMVILKRGMSATIEEWLSAAEYIAIEGNCEIILCERGIRTFETYTRNTLDLNCVPIVKGKTSLKVIVDPSHGTGLRELVHPMSMASIASGADGLIIEVHPEPDAALSDGSQSLDFDSFKKLYNDVNKLYKYINQK